MCTDVSMAFLRLGSQHFPTDPPTTPALPPDSDTLEHPPEELAYQLAFRDPGYVPDYVPGYVPDYVIEEPPPGRVIPDRQRRRCLRLLKALPVIPIVIYGHAEVVVRDDYVKDRPAKQIPVHYDLSRPGIRIS